MDRALLIRRLDGTWQQFERCLEPFEERHSLYRPTEQTLTVAQQVEHVSRSVDWYLDGAFSGQGFDTDFEAFEAAVRRARWLGAARAGCREAFGRARRLLQRAVDKELLAPLPEGWLGGEPRYAIFHSIEEHTAHHRGALAVYCRLLGLEPRSPYSGS